MITVRDVGIPGDHQVIIDRTDGRDTMTLRVERGREADRPANGQTAAVVKESVRNKILVTPEVEIVEYGSLPRSDRKTKRVFDRREDQ